MPRHSWSVYISLSVLVIGALLRAFIDVLPDPVSPAVRFAIEYVDSIIGYYALMFSLPFFAHRVFAVEGRRRDYRIGALVAVALAMQHLTEFWLPKAWDQRGDVFEDVVFASIVVYVLWLGFTRLGDPRVYRPLALRFLALLLIAVPGFLYDLLLGDRSAIRFFPLWYCAVSILITWCLVRRPSAARPGKIPAEWGLSDREAEVARLVQKGLSNKDIAEQLHISPNTVKTHLRADLRQERGALTVRADRGRPPGFGPGARPRTHEIRLNPTESPRKDERFHPDGR